MKITFPLSFSGSDDQVWESPGGFRFCHDMLRHFGLIPGLDYNMEVDFSHPVKERGFTHVIVKKLYPYSRFWHWELNLDGTDYEDCFLGTQVDAMLSHQLINKQIGEVWVRFTEK